MTIPFCLNACVWVNNHRPANLQVGHLMFGYLMLTPTRRRNSNGYGTAIGRPVGRMVQEIGWKPRYFNPWEKYVVGMRQRFLSRHLSHHSLIPVVTVLHSLVDKRQPQGLVVPGSSPGEDTSASFFEVKVSRIFTPHFDHKLRKTERCTLLFSRAPSSSPFVLLPQRLSRSPMGRVVVFCVPGD